MTLLCSSQRHFRTSTSLRAECSRFSQANRRPICRHCPPHDGAGDGSSWVLYCLQGPGADSSSQVYLTGAALTILRGPNQLIQTIYHEDHSTLEAVVICETTGRIAVAEATKVHVYNAFAEQGSLLKACRTSHQSNIAAHIRIVVASKFLGHRRQAVSSIDTFLGRCR